MSNELNILEQCCSLEALSFLATQYVPRMLWKPIFQYHFHKISPPAYMLSQINPIHAL